MTRDSASVPNRPISHRVHLDTTTGPRAVLGSQRPPTRSDAQADSRLVPRSDALRGQLAVRSFWPLLRFGGGVKMRTRPPGPPPARDLSRLAGAFALDVFVELGNIIRARE